MSNEEKRELSTRVNSRRLADYLEQNVRLPCKVLRMVDEKKLLVEASDGGEVTVVVPPNAAVRDTYVEIVGKVSSASSINMLSCIALGSDLDMKLVNDTIELIHDPRFYQKMFR